MTGTRIIGSVIDQARRTLLELKVNVSSAADVRWDRELELLPIANNVQKLICLHRPSAYVKNASKVLAAGIQQAIPADGRALRAVAYNLGADGTTIGRAIQMYDLLTLSSQTPGWTTATGAEVEMVLYDKENPKLWYPYPRPSGTWYVMESYFATPADISAANIDHVTNGLLMVDDEYALPMQNGIVAYALLKNQKSGGDQSKAPFYLSLFGADIGVSYDKLMASMPQDILVGPAGT